MYNFQIGAVYSFNTRAPAVLGMSIKNHTVKGLTDYETACRYINIDLTHRTIYPLLPQGTPNNPKNYTYILLKSESGINTVLAYEWIDDSTITKVESLIVKATIPVNAMADVNKIRDTLTLLGFTGFTLDVTSSTD